MFAEIWKYSINHETRCSWTMDDVCCTWEIIIIITTIVTTITTIIFSFLSSSLSDPWTRHHVRKVWQKTRLLCGFFFCTLPYKSKLWQNERQLLAGDWNGDAGACRRDEVCKSIRSCAPALQQLQQVSDFFLLNIPSLLATGPKLQTVECLVSGIR